MSRERPGKLLWAATGPPYLWMMVTEDECAALKDGKVPPEVREAAVRLVDFRVPAWPAEPVKSPAKKARTR